MQYIHQSKIWPKFTWDAEKIMPFLGQVRQQQGRLLGRMEALGFSLRSEAELQTLTLDIIKSSEIEGEILDQTQVRSSIARKLGLDVAGLVDSERNVDGVVEMILDATKNFDQKLTKNRLWGWHSCLFPGGRSGMYKIEVGKWRSDKHGAMRVVSGAVGKEKIHFQAPDAKRLSSEMNQFLKWFNQKDDMDAVLKSALAHLWFVTLHPFEDGNGRIARAIADMQLARADGSSQRFYSMSTQIRIERKAYYSILERTQKSLLISQKGIDLTEWILWFLACLDQTLKKNEVTLKEVLKKDTFWKSQIANSMNERQKKMINKLIDGFEGKLTTSKWAKITKCSQDTAYRDILELIEKKVLIKDDSGGRSTTYSLQKKD